MRKAGRCHAHVHSAHGRTNTRARTHRQQRDAPLLVELQPQVEKLLQDLLRRLVALDLALGVKQHHVAWRCEARERGRGGVQCGRGWQVVLAVGRALAATPPEHAHAHPGRARAHPC
jgi:hypothetical protein